MNVLRNLKNSNETWLQVIIEWHTRLHHYVNHFKSDVLPRLVGTTSVNILLYILYNYIFCMFAYGLTLIIQRVTFDELSYN